MAKEKHKTKPDLRIEGARQNNLRNISLSLPHDTFMAVTGLSGSGKSSLAFDTIFAEGQWRFIESLSTYTRMFIEKLDRPDVDGIHNIRPAIAVEQRNPVKGSRSTVGSLTEVYDLFRLLYSKIGRPCCPGCGKEIKRWSVDGIISELLENHKGERAMITFRTSETREELIKKGFYRAWNGKEIIDLNESQPHPHLNPLPEGEETLSPPLQGEGQGGDGVKRVFSTEIVVDRLTIKTDPRLADSLEMAYKEGGGRLTTYLFRGSGDAVAIVPITFSRENVCDSCGISVPERTPLLFSFNHPLGACPECNGFGNVLRYDEDLIVPDPYLSIEEGAIEPWEKPAAHWWKEQLLGGAGKAGIDIEKPYRELKKKEKEKLFKGTSHFYGIDDFFRDLEGRRYKLHVRVFLSRYRSPLLCPACKGKRLKPEALVYKVEERNIAELNSMSVKELPEFFSDLKISRYERDVAREVLRQIGMKLGFLKRVGLDYLTLDRLGKTLSGGEYQRVNLANQIASRLVGTLYVLDEPTIGLHARDTERTIAIIREMADAGNTLIVVEHDRQVIASADRIVEMGPGGGEKGGNVVFSGKLRDFLRKNTITARYLRGQDREMLDSLKKMPSGAIREFPMLILKGAGGNNLKSVDVRIPLGTFTVVSGVSGSGKSSLVIDTLYKALARRFSLSYDRPLPFDRIDGEKRLRGVSLIDQHPIGRSPRSNPVTYLKIFDSIRKAFSEEDYSKSQGYKPGFFSFNVPGGRCPRCEGAGFEKLEMYFFEDIYVTCEECNGTRYEPEALKVTHKGRNIHEILEMTVNEAVEFFSDNEAIRSRLAVMQDIALGYIRLGQPATTLSGGEAQRLKICSELGTLKRKNMLYILDEPTVGLHYRDVVALLKVLRRLVDEGNTVLVIEHNLDVVKVAEWVIDLGPEGGPDGGSIVFEGPPEELIRCKESLTGRYLRKETEQWAL